MTTTPGRRAGAGASAQRIADVMRTAERTEQHRRAKTVLPVTAAAAAVLGYAAAVATTLWPAGVVVGLGVVAYGLRRVYRRSANSWATGAAGEVRTAHLLAPLSRRGYIVLHDRAVPSSRANLDHLVAGPAGVFYIDTKNWRSKTARVTVTGGLLRYGRYDKTRELQTVVWEAEQAARALSVPVRPIIAVHGAKVPAPRGRLELHGVTVVEARRLRGLIQSLPPQPGWDADRITAVQQLAERTLPPAR
ncbi:nuclease-related domain-containing protein [Streptantibioticus rubrisoli]|uniref:NERD domain-containing protein n=1 Tax=Streptantibioticus rubrisoli TaxID=1387313 RepID=A0ABT1PKA4_9ACTN|nr:nuclease-related domain-containing protein [Streptantibioticus rubrisoli]MCQ4045802.1 NERD domain-containing protein [Streptantibioticus rubrisoli]